MNKKIDNLNLDLSDFFKVIILEKKRQNEEIISFFEQFKPHKTVEQIAKKHKVDISKIQKQLKMGIKIEKEHTNDVTLAANIALQHLDEFPDYYSKLKKVEKTQK